MPVCIFNTLARSSCQLLLNQLLQQTTPLYTGPCPLSCCPCCRLQPLCPPTPTLTHSCPSPSPLSIAILPPFCRPLCRRRCHPLQLCCRLDPAITFSHCNCAASCPRLLPHTCCHHCMLSHARRRRCPLSHARCIRCPCRTHAGCLPSIAIMPPAAATCCCTHARCLLPHPRRHYCLLLQARRFHHCFRHHCHLRRCWCHMH